MKIILLSAKQGAGKTTLQKALIRHWQNTRADDQGHAVALNFADVLYEMHDAVLGVLHKYWPDRGLIKDGPLLQMLGTEWGRGTIDTDIWVKIAKKKAHSLPGIDLVIVGDCRFENEFDAFPEALRVRLYCPEYVRKTRCEMWRDKTNHPSEVGLDNYYLQNKFDLVLHTERLSVDDCVFKIMAELNENFTHRRARALKKSRL